jgi:PIN domain nuclease of toxin-antitoxin system
VKLLLDSHTLIWAADDPAKLTALAQGLLQDPAHDRGGAPESELISAANRWRKEGPPE